MKVMGLGLHAKRDYSKVLGIPMQTPNFWRDVKRKLERLGYKFKEDNEGNLELVSYDYKINIERVCDELKVKKGDREKFIAYFYFEAGSWVFPRMSITDKKKVLEEIGKVSISPMKIREWDRMLEVLGFNVSKDVDEPEFWEVSYYEDRRYVDEACDDDRYMLFGNDVKDLIFEEDMDWKQALREMFFRERRVVYCFSPDIYNLDKVDKRLRELFESIEGLILARENGKVEV